jgi:hypothetical protein
VDRKLPPSTLPLGPTAATVRGSTGGFSAPPPRPIPKTTAQRPSAAAKCSGVNEALVGLLSERVRTRLVDEPDGLYRARIRGGHVERHAPSVLAHQQRWGRGHSSARTGSRPGILLAKGPGEPASPLIHPSPGAPRGAPGQGTGRRKGEPCTGRQYAAEGSLRLLRRPRCPPCGGLPRGSAKRRGEQARASSPGLSPRLRADSAKQVQGQIPVVVRLPHRSRTLVGDELDDAVGYSRLDRVVEGGTVPRRRLSAAETRATPRRAAGAQATA